MEDLVDNVDPIPLALVADGLRFLRTLTETYGSTKGLEMWHEMGRVMGDNIQGAIFFAMISGNSADSVKLRVLSTNNAVSIIKCIRQYTGNGLKEAKDFYDLSKSRAVDIDCPRNVQSDFSRELRILGCEAY